MGFPDETLEEIKATLSLFHECREITLKNIHGNQGALFRGNLFEYRPYPQTLEWYRLLKRGFSPQDLLNSYYPLFLNGLEERYKNRWSIGIQFSEVSLEEIQVLIREALTTQNDDFNPNETQLSIRNTLSKLKTIPINRQLTHPAPKKIACHENK